MSKETGKSWKKNYKHTHRALFIPCFPPNYKEKDKTSNF